MKRYDVFVSYRRKDSPRVLPLADALRRHGVSVWLDQSVIEDFAPITDEIRAGLAGSKALLAWYSADYPASRPCQMELTAAFLAAQRDGDPRRRVLVINPEASAAHVEPVELRDAEHASAPTDAAGYDALAARVAAQVQSLPTPLGAILPVTPPRQGRLKLVGASRFVGRLRDLWTLHAALHGAESAIIAGTTASGMAQVSGMGGVGKSLLAEEYAFRFGAAYPGGVFWLRAMGHDAARPAVGREHQDAVRSEQFHDLAVALGIDVAGLSPPEVEAALWAAFEKGGQSFLWVVDDLASGLDGEAVRAWLPPHPLGKTLVTTRSREYGSIGKAVPLGVLSPEEAFDLLRVHRQPESGAETAAAHRLVEDLGHHPLAVDVAGAALQARAGLVGFAAVRAHLADPRHDELEFAGELADLLPSGHETSIAATLLRSVRSLPEEGRDFLRLAALLAVAPIPVRLVGATFARVGPLDEEAARRRTALALKQADAASLAEHAGDDARVVHTLIARAVRFHDPDARRSDLRSAVIDALAERLPGVVDIRAHQELALDVLHARELCAQDADGGALARLGAWVGRHDFERGAYASAHRLQEQVLAVRRRVFGEEHPDTLTSMSNLAGTLRAQGDHAGARALQEQVLTVQRRVLGAEHPDTLTSMNNLAFTVWAQGDLAGARALEEQALAVRRRVLGAEHPDTLTGMNNLAATLRLLGDLAGARALEEQALAVRRRVLGAEHPDTLTSMSNLAGTLRAQGDHAGARALREQALTVQRRVLGAEHPDTLTSMNNLAGTLRTQGDLAGARALQEQVLTVQRRVLGEEHPDTLTSMNNLAGTLRTQGDLAGARTLQEQVLTVWRRVLGAEHPAHAHQYEQPRRDAQDAGRPGRGARPPGAGTHGVSPRARRGASPHAHEHEQPRRGAQDAGRSGGGTRPPGAGVRGVSPHARRGASRHAHEHEQPRRDALGAGRSGRGARPPGAGARGVRAACSARSIPTRSPA